MSKLAFRYNIRSDLPRPKTSRVQYAQHAIQRSSAGGLTYEFHHLRIDIEQRRQEYVRSRDRRTRL